MSLPPIKCGGCKTCCEGDTITLHPGDDPTRYKTKLERGVRVLAKRKDGNCVYLGKPGCEIYFARPLECRALDCRRYAVAFDALPEGAKAARLTPQKARVLAEGRRRLGLCVASQSVAGAA